MSQTPILRPASGSEEARFADKRTELAAAALQTLAQLGFARTTLRDIAQNSPYSHGVLHYYFKDKTELITACVQYYKAECIRRYDRIIVDSQTAPELRIAFARGLSATMVDEAHMHRLWYDLRAQCLFEQVFSDDVAVIDKSLERMVWRILRRYADLAEKPLTVTPAYAYSVFDGLFQHALMRHLSGVSSAQAKLRQHVRLTLDQMFGG